MGKAYWFAPRSQDVSHQHPFLVFNGHDQLHFELTVFGKEASAQTSLGTTRTYLHAILPFFLYLDTDEWQKRAGRKWDNDPSQIRQAVTDYLVQHQQCKVHQHHLGFQIVSFTTRTPSTIRVFLAGLRLFYHIMQQKGYYQFANPLVDTISKLVTDVEQRLASEEEFPRIPGASGVEQSYPKLYVSDSYFKLKDHEWVPQVVDDAELFRHVLEAGERVHWGLREICVARLLFETGARVSEVVGLTLGDWAARGMLQEANTFNKGSHGKRMKFLRFSSETAKLLRRYFNGDRQKLDRNNYTVEDYLQLAKQKRIDLQTVPLFLSTQRTPLSAKSFRENFWYPACQTAGMRVRIHQIRHWHVTLAVRHIHETSSVEGEVQRRLQELVEYMKWKSKETLGAYEHYFDAARHAETLDSLHVKMESQLQFQLQEKKIPHLPKPSVTKAHPSSASLPPEPDLDFLYHLGGDE